MWASPNWVPLNRAPQKVVPMPSSSRLDSMRSDSFELERAIIPAIRSSISSPSALRTSHCASERAASVAATADARSPAAAPPMPSATSSMVGEA